MTHLELKKRKAKQILTVKKEKEQQVMSLEFQNLDLTRVILNQLINLETR